MGTWFAELHRSEGVDLILGEQVLGYQGERRVKALLLGSGRVVQCDHVLVGVGVAPDLNWLTGSGLDTRGVQTDADSRSEAPDVYAAGDAAAVFDPLLGRHVLGGHWESAARQGMRAAKAMLGLDTGPPAVSSFWSDMYETRVQYLGHASPDDDVHFDGDPGSREFTATFMRREQPVAVLLVGRPQLLPEARALLSRPAEAART